MDKVIDINDLIKTYKLPKPQNGKREFNAVDGVSFNVEKGEVFGIEWRLLKLKWI